MQALFIPDFVFASGRPTFQNLQNLKKKNIDDVTISIPEHIRSRPRKMHVNVVSV
jgi:hypothetical protein